MNGLKNGFNPCRSVLNETVSIRNSDLNKIHIFVCTSCNDVRYILMFRKDINPRLSGGIKVHNIMSNMDLAINSLYEACSSVCVCIRVCMYILAY